MEYKIVINNDEYYLPKCTLEIEEMVEELDIYLRKRIKKEIGIRDFLEAELKFINFIFGEDITKKILNFEQITEIDTKELEILVYKVCSTYGSVVTEYKMKSSLKQAQFLNDEKLNKLLTVASTVNKDE